MKTGYKHFRIKNIGNKALPFLKGGVRIAKVCGVTSKGIFLALDDDVILFLTEENPRGPLVVNMEPTGDLRNQIDTGNAVRIGEGRIVHEASGMVIDIDPGTIIWSPPLVTGNIQLKSVRQDHIRSLISILVEEKPDAGFAEDLIYLAGLKPAPIGAKIPSDILDHLIIIGSDIKQQDWENFSRHSVEILGYGRGLTPSGDDFILGIFLSLTRWQHFLVDQISWQKSVDLILDAAQSRTTRISLNLLKCAASGEADERLIDAVDFIFTGIPDVHQTANGLLQWGNSSGIDSTAGMIVVSESLP